MQTSYQEDEIEIDLQDLFGLLLHKAWIIILAAIVAGMNPPPASISLPAKGMRTA